MRPLEKHEIKAAEWKPPAVAPWQVVVNETANGIERFGLLYDTWGRADGPRCPKEGFSIASRGDFLLRHEAEQRFDSYLGMRHDIWIAQCRPSKEEVVAHLRACALKG